MIACLARFGQIGKSEGGRQKCKRGENLQTSSTSTLKEKAWTNFFLHFCLLHSDFCLKKSGP
jgi:hypothetical protein